MKTLTLLILLPMLTACGSSLPIKQVNQQAQSLPIYQQGQPHPVVKADIGIVSGHSCKNKLWDTAANEPDALKQLKTNAHERGADGVVNVIFNTQGTSLNTNCWESIQATGNAVRFE